MSYIDEYIIFILIVLLCSGLIVYVGVLLYCTHICRHSTCKILYQILYHFAAIISVCICVICQG